MRLIFLFLRLLTGVLLYIGYSRVSNFWNIGGFIAPSHTASRGIFDEARVMKLHVKFPFCAESFLCMENNQARISTRGIRKTDVKKITAESFIRSFMSPQRRVLEAHFRA